MTTAATKPDLLAEAHEYADEIAKKRADEYAKGVRDAVLCPEHAQTLEHQLKDIVAGEALARVLERYHDDFPDEYHFALGATAPTMLQEIFHALLAGSEADEKQAEKDRAKRRQVFRPRNGLLLAFRPRPPKSGTPAR
jgi:hypothetical protein